MPIAYFLMESFSKKKIEKDKIEKKKFFFLTITEEDITAEEKGVNVKILFSEVCNVKRKQAHILLEDIHKKIMCIPEEQLTIEQINILKRLNS